MGEDIREKTETEAAESVKAEAGTADTKAADNTAAGTAESNTPESSAAETTDTAAKAGWPAETRLEWRETLGLQLSDIEDYMVNAGVNGESESLDDDHADKPEANAANDVPDETELKSADSADYPDEIAGAKVPAPGEIMRAAETGPEKKGQRFGRFLMAFLLGAAVASAAFFAFGSRLLPGNGVNGIGSESESGSESYSADSSYDKFFEIMQMIGEDPIAEKDPKDITDEELKEIVASIGDPYAEYYTASEYEEQQKRYMNDFVGIGIGVTEEDGAIVIKSIFRDTPAEAAGMQPEDIIVKVDGAEPETVDDAISMISGKEGTEVTVTVKRGEELIDFTLERAKIETDSVEYSQVPDHPDIGYISMTLFRKGTCDEFKDAVKALQAEGCDKFILDLRDNGGGLTDECIDIADYLLPSCKIMSENTKRGKETVYNSKSSSADLQLIVLVNENTASASEILTAALQDNGACTVIGTNTYGKGVIQIMHEFDDGSAVKITTSEYFRPNGKPVNGVGITPDIEAGDEEAFDTAIRELTK